MARFYREAYTALATVTPIAADCGKLCGHRCCSGGSEDGMILFPGEAEFLGLACLTREMRGVKVGFYTCSGRCSRSRRPLSCRIYPYAPYYKDGVLSVIPDPRAQYTCPLLTEDAKNFIQPEFLSAIESAFSALLQDPEVKEMLVRYSAMLDDYKRFTTKKE